MLIQDKNKIPKRSLLLLALKEYHKTTSVATTPNNKAPRFIPVRRKNIIINTREYWTIGFFEKKAVSGNKDNHK